MKIQILQMIEGARKARGLTVVIDVFRAFSLECYLMAKHPSRLCPVGAEQTARDLKRRYPEAVLIGERHGVILPGFEYGNSPSQTEAAELEGKMMIHTTSAGTQGIVNASGATEILTGSLVNAAAIARYIKASDTEEVSLVAMGWEGKEEAPEDVLCARYIKSLLEVLSIILLLGLHIMLVLSAAVLWLILLLIRPLARLMCALKLLLKQKSLLPMCSGL